MKPIENIRLQLGSRIANEDGTYSPFPNACELFMCGLSHMYQLPYVSPEDVPIARESLEAQKITDPNARQLLHNYLNVCAEGSRLGEFPDLGIKVTGVIDATEGSYWGMLRKNLGLVDTSDRLVSSRVRSKMKKHPHPIVQEITTAMVYWTSKLWDGDKSNEWVDHFNAEDAWTEIISRGLTPRSSMLDTDKMGYTLGEILIFPKTVSILFDLEERRFALSHMPNTGYLDSDIPKTCRAGLSRAYEISLAGVASMLEDFEASDWGPIPHTDVDSSLTVCVSYRHFRKVPSDNEEEKTSTSLSRISKKAREQLASFVLSMGRFHKYVRFWCDSILKSRNIRTDKWETVGLLPYAVWPTVYISGYSDEPERNSFNKLWVRIEQFCAAYGRGVYVMSFDLFKLQDPNPWVGTIVTSVAEKKTGRLGGRHEGVPTTMYVLFRAVRYGLFEEFVGTWREYYEHTFKDWAYREEERLVSTGSVSATPFVFSDEQLVAVRPTGTLVFQVHSNNNNEPLNFDGDKLLRPRVDNAASSALATDESSYVHGEVWRKQLDGGKGEISYVVISRPLSGYSNCWMCEVRHGEKFAEGGSLMKIVHYISCCGHIFLTSFRNEYYEDESGVARGPYAGQQPSVPPSRAESAKSESDDTYKWYHEANPVIEKLLGSESSLKLDLLDRQRWEGPITIVDGLPTWGL